MTTQIKIVEYDEIANQIDTVRESANFLPDVTTEEGYKASKRVSLDVGKLLTALEKTRKERKAHYLEGGRQVDSQAKEIVATLELIQLPHKEAYKELDTLKKEREADRKAKLAERVEYIRMLPEQLKDSSSDEIKAAMSDMQKEECLDFFEFADQALKARNATRETLGKMFVEKDKAEKDAIELEELRAKQAAQEKKEREDKIAADARAKADKEKAEAVEREKAAKKMAQDAETARVEAEQKAKSDAEEAEKARIKAEDTAKKEAEEAKKKADMEAKQAKIQTEKDAHQAAENAEKEKKAAAEKAKKDQIAKQKAKEKTEADAVAKREANEKHVSKIRGEAKDDLMTLHGVDEEMAKDIVLAINSGKIRNVSITY